MPLEIEMWYSHYYIVLPPFAREAGDGNSCLLQVDQQVRHIDSITSSTTVNATSRIALRLPWSSHSFTPSDIGLFELVR